MACITIHSAWCQHAGSPLPKTRKGDRKKGAPVRHGVFETVSVNWIPVKKKPSPKMHCSVRSPRTVISRIA